MKTSIARIKSKPDSKAEIDLTPMLDVVFIMLIFFIVTASFVREKSLGLNLMPKINSESSDSAVAIFNVNANNDISLDGRSVDIRSVRSVVAQKLAENSGMSVVVNAHEQSNTETYMAILDAARQAKYPNVMLKTYGGT
ncbi:ExbD/TolR family protein [Teredinibacter waterburyi]|jgi:outer membrane transport energization protein ExbD (TC 2.C.1.1.1)|uniref:ExbD/TolR family protein n=1 Tax=Teredinibacter waterburyi TaxID=1500538 RepID=UPI00165EC446|nr:biopolymer transporter ExbD [Teredinibacter waterburyi]